MNQQKESKRTTRERAAAARAAAEAEQRRRENRIRLLIGLGVGVLVVGIVAVGVIGSRKSDVGIDASAALPLGVTAADGGVPYGTGTAAVPQLELWEDFQCSACKALEAANGAGIQQLAQQGKIRLVYRPATFLDANLGNDSSLRAAAAWGCAVDAGKTAEYHNQVFANQPQEGVGYTDQTLQSFATAAGITGSSYDTFTACMSAKKYQPWVANSAHAFDTNAVPGTPTGYLSFGGTSTELTIDVLQDPAQLQAAIDAASK